jgi:hypothetical protein
MHWNLAIQRNQEPLQRIIAALFALIGLGPDFFEKAPSMRLPWQKYRAVLRILRPAEWAVRRLVLVVAHGTAVKALPQRKVPFLPHGRPPQSGRNVQSGSTGKARITFKLFDPRKRFDHRDDSSGSSSIETYVSNLGPRIRTVDVAFDPRVLLFHQPAARAPKSDGAVNALPLCRRLAAIKLALDDLPRQAKRYLRWQAKSIEVRKPMLSSPLRPGAPPGLGTRSRYEVHKILRECHDLAYMLPAPNTS